MAWFAELNRRGGVHGRQLRLVSLDDRYEPALTLANTRRLIGPDRAFILFGYVGTPTVKAVLLREPFRPMVFNLRASYQAEIDRIVNDLVRSGRLQPQPAAAGQHGATDECVVRGHRRPAG